MHSAPLEDDVLEKLAIAAARIPEAWALLSARGFSLVDRFFRALDLLKVDGAGLEPPQFFFVESLRELLSTQFAAWTWLERSRLNPRYRSAYLDWIEEQHRSNAWPQMSGLGGRAKDKLDPAFARYLRLKYATPADPEIHALWQAMVSDIAAIKDVEARALLEKSTAMRELKVRASASGVRQLLELAFAGSRFEYDSARSTDSAMSYSRTVPDSTASIVCSFGDLGPFRKGFWPLTLGVASDDVREPLRGIDPGFPVAFGIDSAFPGTSPYLGHDNKPELIKLGAAFFATASTLFADLVSEAPETLSLPRSP
jgi:hypothetical protein